MNRRLKFMGTALIAVFAMSVLFASMASADDLTSEVSPVTLTGAGEETGPGINRLSLEGIGVTDCPHSTYTATTATPTTTVTVTPSYTGCTSLGFPAIVDTNGCTYVLQMGTGAKATTITSKISCPVGQKIRVTANAPAPATLKCTIEIGPQENLEKIEVTNAGTLKTRDLLFHLEIGGITATRVKGTGLGACPEGVSNGSSLTGTVTITGEEDKALNPEHVGIFVS
jgi:hypothetical protein